MFHLPRSAHSLRSLKRSGVPGSGFPLWDSISKPMLKEATPLELPEQGNRTLNTVIKPWNEGIQQTSVKEGGSKIK